MDIGGIGNANWRQERAAFRFQSTRESVEADALNTLDVFHYSIPIVQETGTGRVESGDTIDSSKLLITNPTILVSKLNPRKATVCIAEPHPVLLTVASGEFVSLEPKIDHLRYAFYVWSSELVRQRQALTYLFAMRTEWPPGRQK